MDLALTLVALIVLSIPLAGIAAASGSPDLLAGLFRQSDDLGWPVGVQEEDVPPAFGSRIAPKPETPDVNGQASEEGAERHEWPLDGSIVVRAEEPAARPSDRAWSARVHDVRLVAGTARR